MMFKARNFSSLLKPRAWWCLAGCRQDRINCIGEHSTLLHRAFCAVAEPLSGTTESPELPGWVKFPKKESGVKKSEDDDFVPPSVLYWIENHKVNARDSDMKSIVNDIVQSDIDKISEILKGQFESPDLVVKALDGCGVDVSESLVEQVLNRFCYQWIPAFGFFKWAEMQKGIKHSPSLYNLMVDNLGKMKKFDIMWELVGDMNELHGYVTLDTMTKVLRRYAKAGKYDDAVEAFRKLENFGIKRDATSMNILMNSLVKEGSAEHAERVFLEFKNHISPTLQTYNVLVHGWCKSRQIDKAKRTLEEMKANGFTPDAVTYTCFIEAYAREKDFRKIDKTLEEMRKNGFLPSVVTYTIIMTALSKAKETNKAIEVYEKMKQENCSIDASFCSAFMSALSKAGRLKDSDAVFEDMLKEGINPDAIHYARMIKIATENSQEEKALTLLMKMEESGYKPDLNMYAPLLKMCCKLNRMKVLSFLMSHMFKNDVSIDLGTYSLLVTGLCRRGKLERACSFFEEMIMKGFVPMDSTYKNLVEQLEKKGMDKEKLRIEELMPHAKREESVHSSMKTG